MNSLRQSFRDALLFTLSLGLLATGPLEVAGAAQAGSTATLATAGVVDVTKPENGINDPAAHVPVLHRDCSDGQVDINTASASEITAAFGLNSAPTVRRIIDARPWLTTGDLVSVPGVPPSMEPTLVSRGCAEPVTLPESAPLACTSPQQVDLQTASVEDISSGLKLPRVTAEAIVDHRPVPQDLSQIVAPRSPGFTISRIQMLLESKKVCVTPVPFAFAGTDWRWIYPAAGGVVESSDDPDYALIVPPGAVTGATFGRVTPKPDQPLPTADVHLYGPFTGEVAIRLPDFGAGDPVVLHATPAGTSVSWGDSTAVEPGGTVVAPLKSLSEASASGRDLFCGPLYGYTMNVTCMNTSPRDLPVLELFREAGRVTGQRLSRQPAQGECSTGDSRLVAEGSTPPGLICSASANATDRTRSTWTFNNVLASAIVDGWIESFGAIYNVYPSGGTAPESAFSTSPGPENAGTLSGPIARFFADRGFLVPGSARNFVKPQGDAPTTTTAFVENAVQLSVIFSIFQVVDVVDAGLTLVNVDLPGFNISACGAKIVDSLNGNGTAGAAVECVKSLVENAIEAAAAETDDAGKAAKLRGLAAGLKKALIVPTLLSYGSSLITSLVTGGPFNDQSMTFQYLPPPPPAGGGGGGSSGGGAQTAGSLGLDGSGNFIARIGVEGFLVGRDGYARPITTPAQFLCYASRLAVVDYVTKYQVGGVEYLNLGPAAQIVSSPAPGCLTTPFLVWDFEPPPEGNTPYNVILRGQFDGTTHPSWLINSRGEIQTIPDGGTYICLAASNPVIWEVPFSKIQAWRPVGSAPASCG